MSFMDDLFRRQCVPECTVTAPTKTFFSENIKLLKTAVVLPHELPLKIIGLTYQVKKAIISSAMFCASYRATNAPNLCSPMLL